MIMYCKLYKPFKNQIKSWKDESDSLTDANVLRIKYLYINAIDFGVYFFREIGR
jgi:hypothetical protein